MERSEALAGAGRRFSLLTEAAMTPRPPGARDGIAHPLGGSGHPIQLNVSAGT